MIDNMMMGPAKCVLTKTEKSLLENQKTNEKQKENVVVEGKRNHNTLV